MRKEKIITGEYYHVYSRGADRRLTFYDDHDRERFIRSMIAFNDLNNKEKKLSRLKCRPVTSTRPLVKILSYALMPNHHHFLVRQLVDDGIGLYMQRIGAGYACYFNKRHKRTGCLWESEYKAVRIETDAQLLHISRYIHLNPLKLFFPNWKTDGVPCWEEAHHALKLYMWSSYPHFLGIVDDPLVNDGLFATLFSNATDYENFMHEWVMSAPEMSAPQART